MASIDRADPAIMGHLLAQHRELHDLLVDARAGLASQAYAAARERLVTLRDHLSQHFQQE